VTRHLAESIRVATNATVVIENSRVPTAILPRSPS